MTQHRGGILSAETTMATWSNLAVVRCPAEIQELMPASNLFMSVTAVVPLEPPIRSNSWSPLTETIRPFVILTPILGPFDQFLVERSNISVDDRGLLFAFKLLPPARTTNPPVSFLIRPHAAPYLRLMVSGSLVQLLACKL